MQAGEETFGRRIRWEPMVFRAFRRKLERSEAKWKLVGSNPTPALFTKAHRLGWPSRVSNKRFKPPD